MGLDMNEGCLKVGFKDPIAYIWSMDMWCGVEYNNTTKVEQSL
jgi:hypothetical protein